VKYLSKYKKVFKGKDIVQPLMRVNDNCMPALIGGFGKIKTQIRSFTIESNNNSELKSKLGAYLAGLIEADGSFAIHNKNSNSKRYLPKILIVFSLNDKPLAEKLISITETGKLYIRQNQGCVI
jgi:hypothetical protein